VPALRSLPAYAHRRKSAIIPLRVQPAQSGRPSSLVYGNCHARPRLHLLLENGREGSDPRPELAVLNETTLRARLRDVYRGSTALHARVWVSDKSSEETGVTTLDSANFLIDYGYHPPTI